MHSSHPLFWLILFAESQNFLDAFFFEANGAKKKAYKKETPKVFRALRSARRATRPSPAPPFEKGGRKPFNHLIL